MNNVVFWYKLNSQNVIWKDKDCVMHLFIDISKELQSEKRKNKLKY